MSGSLVEAGHRELLAVLVEHQVDFVLVGGVGLQLKGYSGATRDVDVTIAVDTANQTRLHAALQQLRAVAYLAGDRGTAYRTDLGQLEIMRRTDGVGDYTQWALHAARVDLGDGQQVLVGSASDLLAAKEAAGREKDLRRAAAHPGRAAGPWRPGPGRCARPGRRAGRRSVRRPARRRAARLTP